MRHVEVKIVKSTINDKAFKVAVFHDGEWKGCLNHGRSWKSVSGALKAARKAFPGADILVCDHGSILGYQAFAGLVLALGVLALSHGAFALAISFFAGWR